MSSFLNDLPTVSFFGRPFSELMRCFGLSLSDLRGLSILECPSGPSSFVAEATRLGLRAAGVDPLFYRNPAALAALARSDFDAMFARMRAAPRRFVPRTYPSIEAAESARRAGLERFLRDYPDGFAAGRYRAGSLPELPFGDASYDLVLCAHFLFVYADQFDLAFHERAVRELCRVARREIRIHPLVDGAHRRYADLGHLIELAAAMGFRSEIRTVDHEFFKGANETLVLTRE